MGLNGVSDNSAWSRRNIVGLCSFIAVCAAVSILGGLATANSVTDWYLTLNRPSFNPPGWVFGPVWTVLYLFIAVAGWRVWRGPPGEARRRALTLYGVQLALNLAWSFLFFGLQRPDLGLLDILALLAAISWTTVLFWRLDRLSGLLFMPYVLWVAFASVLNASIWWLN